MFLNLSKTCSWWRFVRFFAREIGGRGRKPNHLQINYQRLNQERELHISWRNPNGDGCLIQAWFTRSSSSLIHPIFIFIFTDSPSGSFFTDSPSSSSSSLILVFFTIFIGILSEEPEQKETKMREKEREMRKIYEKKAHNKNVISKDHSGAFYFWKKALKNLLFPRTIVDALNIY